MAQADNFTKLKNHLSLLESWQWPLFGAFVLIQAFTAGLIFSRLLSAPGMAGKEWETLCVAEAVVGRKCLMAVGWKVTQGYYILAIGHTAVGLISIGVFSTGLVAIGHVGVSLFYSVVLAGISLTYIQGLLVLGGKSPRCVVGGTLIKDPSCQGVLNYSFINIGKYSKSPKEARSPKSKAMEWPHYSPHDTMAKFSFPEAA